MSPEAGLAAGGSVVGVDSEFGWETGACSPCRSAISTGTLSVFVGVLLDAVDPVTSPEGADSLPLPAPHHQQTT